MKPLLLHPLLPVCSDKCTASHRPQASLYPASLPLQPRGFQCNKTCPHLVRRYIQIVVTSSVVTTNFYCINLVLAPANDATSYPVSCGGFVPEGIGMCFVLTAFVHMFCRLTVQATPQMDAPDMQLLQHAKPHGNRLLPLVTPLPPPLWKLPQLWPCQMTLTRWCSQQRRGAGHPKLI